MIVMLDAGAFRVMCKHLQLKGNTYYYRMIPSATDDVANDVNNDRWLG